MSTRLLCPCAVIALALVGAPPAHARDLTFEERVAAQEAIERVYYSHRDGSTKSFEEAVSRDTLERRVRDYLDRSVALEQFWNRPVTAEGLQRETQRIARGSKIPGRLLELYAALGNDAFLVQESLARRTLVRRLTRNLFAFDERIHGELRRQAEELRGRVERGEIDPRTAHPERRVVELVRVESRDEAERTVRDGAIELLPESYDRLRGRLPRRLGGIGRLAEDRTSFSFRVLLDEDPQRMTIAVYRMDKRTWEDWRAPSSSRVATLARAVASETLRLSTPGPVSTVGTTEECQPGPDNVWDNGILGLYEVETATAVWTGSEMIVWGGRIIYEPFGAGGVYDPLLDSWTAISNESAPTPRGWHTAVWTGTEMIVWGGIPFGTGGRYDPISDSWSSVSISGAPDERYRHTAVWTGTEMIVWGGLDGSSVVRTGGRYDPVSDAWTPTSLASAPTARMLHTAVWTGTEVIIWGGGTNQSKENTGGRYDPALDQWTPTSLSLFAPSPRWKHTAVWTGSEMIVFGGERENGTATNDGARYDPSSNFPEHAWIPISTAGAVAHWGHAAVWTGSEMMVWGGSSRTGQRYDLSSDTWMYLPLIDLGAEQDERTAAVWSGTDMIVWHRGRGARYAPSTNTWVPNIQPVELSGKADHSAVWTGNEMIVFGGRTDDTGPIEGFNTGGRYDPVLDTWDATTLHGAPSPRQSHTAVWTGSEMIVWGGSHSTEPSTDTGGRYDPSSDTWSPTSLSFAPLGRRYHTAVWTGSEMIVWGGSLGGNTGGRYDPASDTWVPTSVAGAPDGRIWHTAVWTGDEMVVWGGYSSGGINTGGRYDPATDGWSPTSMIDVPEPAYFHAATWIGSEMVVVGGGAAGRYEVLSDSWVPLNAAAWVRNIEYPTAVWTGQHVIVWGGVANVNDGGTNNGFRFPLDGTGLFMSLANAPPGRYRHTAVWTGAAMIVWGGVTRFNLPYLHSGGLYFSTVDADGDGVTNDCDCAPDDPGAFDVPSEILNVRWMADGSTIEWDTDAPNSGPGTTYDVVRGNLAGLPVGGAGELCLEPDSEDTSAGDATLLPPGSGFYYLVRGDNVCDAGSYGTDSFDVPRVSAICP